MNGLDITRSIGVPYLNLENFEFAEPDTRYILTSPRSLEACERCDIRPVELLRHPVEEFYDEYKNRDYLTRSEILEEFHLQEKVRLAKLSQAREERQRIIYLEDEEEPIREFSVARKARAGSPPQSPHEFRSKSPKNAWNSSINGAELKLRHNTEYDGISNNPQRVHNTWASTLRTPSPTRKSSTPMKSAFSHEDLSITGSKPKRSILRPRSASLPRKRTYLDDTNGEFRGNLSCRSQHSDSRLESSSVEDLRRSYDRLLQSHKDLTANISHLEQQLKEIQLNQERDNLLEKKKVNIEALRLRKQANKATTKAKISRGNYHRAKNLESKVNEYALKKLKAMESTHRSQVLRETQTHINELKAEIRQYKAQRTARVLQEQREDWIEAVTRRQSRAQQRADIKARRNVRDRSSRARRLRIEKEQKHAENMKNLVLKEELTLLRNLDNIISKDRRSEDLVAEKTRLLRQYRDTMRRTQSTRSNRKSKSFDEMSKEADMMARLERKGISSYIKLLNKPTKTVKDVQPPATTTRNDKPPAPSSTTNVASSKPNVPANKPTSAIKPALKSSNAPKPSEAKKVTIVE